MATAPIARFITNGRSRSFCRTAPDRLAQHRDPARRVRARDAQGRCEGQIAVFDGSLDDEKRPTAPRFLSG